MSELIPSVLFSSQTLKLIAELREAHKSGLVKDIDDLVKELANALTGFNQHAGEVTLEYDPVVPGEPPSSDKANLFWRDAQRDVNILQQQVDILRAAALFSHNLITTEIQQARNQNARINNKLKSLQLYSDSSDSKVLTFGDYFQSLEFVDQSLIPDGQRLSLFTAGHITLPQRGELVNLSTNAEVRIAEGSNGFLGNNQEIEPPGDVSATGDEVDDVLRYRYKSETDLRGDLSTIIDEEPDTWIEYERYGLTEDDIAKGLYNFEYIDPDADEGDELVNWARPPEDNVLRLVLEFDLGSVQSVNTIQVLPYGLENDKNYPILISNIMTSSNGTDWTPIHPGNVFVGTDINLKTARAAASSVIDRAVWAFDTRSVRYVRAFFLQQYPIRANIGHTYWVLKTNENIRTEGPIPSIEDTTEFHERYVDGNLLQRREYFVGDRWAIGLRDFLIQQVEYETFGVLVTRPLRVGGVVDRVILHEADFDIPDSYPSEALWVRFYVSPDDGENWYPISRIQDPDLGIPEQIAFNDPTPAELRDPGVAYYTVNREVTSLRLKVEMVRPDNSVATTPVLRSYILKVRKR